MSAIPREKRPPTPRPTESPSSPTTGPPAAQGPSNKATPPPSGETLPFLLDFFPLETSDQTRLSTFFDRLRSGTFSTTRCTRCGQVHWPPRVACPECHADTLEWVELPRTGTVYAHSAVLVGAPIGMENDVPFSVGLVDLEDSSLRIFGRIEGKPWNELQVGDRVQIEPYDVPGGRVFYRFRVI